MPHHDIDVSLDSSNQVTVNPNSVPARSSHTVRWICKAGALRIIFKGTESPLNPPNLTVSAPSGDTGVLHLRRPSKKHFKYTAEVTPVGSGPYSLDPELVIADGGGGPKKKVAKASATKKKTKKK